MSRAFDLMLTEVHRFEGTVNQFSDDGIMALFGADRDRPRPPPAAPSTPPSHRARAHATSRLRPTRITFPRPPRALNTGLVVGAASAGPAHGLHPVGDTPT